MLPIIRTKNIPTFSDDLWGGDLLRSFFDEKTGENIPAVNIKENDDSFQIDLAAPGLEKKDFNIHLDNNLLTISAEKEFKNEEKKGDKYMRREFSYSSFSRSFTLPDTVESDKIKASHKDGVLQISIPKNEDAKKKAPKEIKIS